MGLPEIFINFQTAAVSAITRSARGVLAVALTDATEGGAVEAVYKSLAEVPRSSLPPGTTACWSWHSWRPPARCTFCVWARTPS